MEVLIKGSWYKVAGSIPTSSARHSITWKLSDGFPPDVDLWVGAPETEFTVRGG